MWPVRARSRTSASSRPTTHRGTDPISTVSSPAFQRCQLLLSRLMSRTQPSALRVTVTTSY
eukprot:224877-Prymnesium_polylepis.1